MDGCSFLLCWFPPVMGLKGSKLSPSVPDLATGFPLTGMGSTAHSEDAAQVHLLAL